MFDLNDHNMWISKKMLFSVLTMGFLLTILWLNVEQSGVRWRIIINLINYSASLYNGSMLELRSNYSSISRIIASKHIVIHFKCEEE